MPNTDKESNEKTTTVIIKKDYTNALGIASFIFGVISIFILAPIFVPLALILGIIAVIKKQPIWGGLGLMCGVIGFLTSPILLGLFGLLSLGVLLDDKPKSTQVPTKPKQETRILVECWGQDISDGRIGGWKSSFPNCILDDGGGHSNAIYNGRVKLDGNKLYITMENLKTEAPPNNILAVGFKIRLENRTFSDGTTTKIVEMKRFNHWPDSQPIQKSFELK